MAELEAQPEALGEEAILSADGTVRRCLQPWGYQRSIAIVGEGEKGYLVCVPGAAWNKKSAQRRLPNGSLIKPLSLSVTGCDAADRINAIAEYSVHIWLGWLGAGFDASVSFAHAGSLEAAAREKFGLQNVEEPEPQADRLTALENKFVGLQDSIDKLLQLQSGGGFVSMPLRSRQLPPR